MTYEQFLESKRHRGSKMGIEPTFIPDRLFDFQKYVATHIIQQGRFAGFLDTGTGKTIIELTVAINYHAHTQKPVLIITPLAVAFQFLKEAKKFDITGIEYSRDGKFSSPVVVCNMAVMRTMRSTYTLCS